MVGWGEKWRTIRPFFLIFFLHSVAILLFTRGFLLTRTELSTFSQCSDLSQSPCFHPTPTTALPRNITEGSTNRGVQGPDPGLRDQRCWTKPAVDRLVIVILDAISILRCYGSINWIGITISCCIAIGVMLATALKEPWFDFVAPSAFFEEAKPWMDKLRVLQKLASDGHSSAKIFKAIADPPTTSLQRLKGLTTGGLPTFIDVGNSFGAPAIIEDNLIHQLVKNGKRVLMMGDDTWIQLFPDHFAKSYPFPSFIVKDLHTVDNGCIENLLPALYEGDWDVLVAHFLGVDHAGHIFGVDSAPMLEKLEQYNTILEKVVEILKIHSGPGGLHENTFLIVMGDHGQTLNGDHGGGTAEEVETSLFAMSMRRPPTSVSPELDSSTCKLDLEGKRICFSSIQQLDFAATMAALLGIPFPFGSIGRVSPELYALSAGTWNGQSAHSESFHDSNLEAWLQNYADVLCINCWQVKRYIDSYSASSVIGFPKEDLMHVAQNYAQAQSNWSINKMNIFSSGIEVSHGGRDSSQSILLGQIDAFSNFLEGVAELARSKWTEFDLKMMAVGFCVLLLSLLVQILAIKRVTKELQVLFPYFGNPGTAVRFLFSIFIVAIRACSFLSNSYILAEGKVAKFLLASTGILNLRDSIREEKMVVEALVFLLLNFIIGLTGEVGLSKQAVSSALTDILPLRILKIDEGHFIGLVLLEILPMLGLMILGFMLYRSASGSSCWRFLKYFFVGGTFISYMLIAVHWALESNMLTIPAVLECLGRTVVPRVVYAIGFGLLLLAFTQMADEKEKTSYFSGRTFIATVAMLSAWNSTVLLLLGRQGPFVAIMSIFGGWCITKLQTVALKDSSDGADGGFVVDFLSVTQWSLLAVCLFFYSGHWCAFDGLRYGAAFIGFDDFNLIRQGILLAIDTFGISHIFPIIGLPLLAVSQYSYPSRRQGERIIFMNLTQAFLIYGLIATVTTTFMIICVTIQRRHLMVWGLFAPKYVFDVVGLMLTDLLICLASLYYF